MHGGAVLVNCRRMRHIVSINSDGNSEPIAEPEAELSSTTPCTSGLDQAHVLGGVVELAQSTGKYSKLPAKLPPATTVPRQAADPTNRTAYSARHDARTRFRVRSPDRRVHRSRGRAGAHRQR